MASNFLENLKNAVETGEFNSEAAKKINEIDKLADTINPKDVEEKIKKIEPVPVSEEEAAMVNSDYEKKMAEIEKENAANKQKADMIDMVDKQLATLIEIEEMVRLSVDDMMGFIDELEDRFPEEITETPHPLFAGLSNKIDEIKSRYSNFLDKEEK
jgi:hypothetical protein